MSGQILGDPEEPSEEQTVAALPILPFGKWWEFMATDYLVNWPLAIVQISWLQRHACSHLRFPFPPLNIITIIIRRRNKTLSIKVLYCSKYR